MTTAAIGAVGAATYSQAFEAVLAGGSIEACDHPALPRIDVLRTAAASIIAAAAELSAWLDDQHEALLVTRAALTVAIAKCRVEGIPIPDDLKLGLRGLALQADFAAGLRRAGGLS